MIGKSSLLAMLMVLGVTAPAVAQQTAPPVDTSPAPTQPAPGPAAPPQTPPPTQTPVPEQASPPEPETGVRPLTIEAKHSSVIFFYPHFGLSHPSGKIVGAQGKIVFDRDHPERSSVDVTLEMNSLVTGLPDFDQLLKGPDYFDAARFPQAHFISRQITVTDTDTGKITGDLTLHGVTKSITLDTKFNKRAFNPALFKTGTGFSATATLSRSAFGLGRLEPFVGDDINLQIEVEGY